MQENSISVSYAEGHSPNVEDLCVAMFLEAARVLGFELDAPISQDAQARILQAANFLGEKLTVLLEIRTGIECEPELGN